MEKFKLANKKLTTKLIAILLIFCMTFANFALVGSNIVEAATNELENQETITKGDKVEFDAYLDKASKAHEAELSIEETGTLYLKVAVKDKVSVQDATIKIEDANFSINQEAFQENKYVSNVDTEKNEIEISSISSNNTAEIEVPINFKKQDVIETTYLNKEMTVSLEGTYQDTNRREKKLEGAVQIKPQWTANADTKVTQSIEKYFSLGANGTLLQQKIETEVINNVLPRTEETLVTAIPTISNERPQEVTVLIDGEKVRDDQIQYNEQEGTLTISYMNLENNENKIQWGEAKKEYTIMYRYSGAAEVTETPMTLSTNVQTSLYSKEKPIEKVDFQELQVTPIGNIATVETSMIGEIYKGYLYENEAKEIQYTERNDIGVSYTEGIDKVELATNNVTYVNEAGAGIIAGDNIKYKQTKINKDEMLQLLGGEGTIKIKRANGEEIVTLNKETETDDQGIITIDYGEGEANIIIETSKPQIEGKMTVLNIRAINGQTNQPKEVIKQIKQLIVTPEITTNISKELASSSIEMKETTTQAKLEISNNNLSTIQENQNVEIKATLNTNSPSQDLYLNPSLEIVFPEDVQEVKVNGINKLYGDEFTEIKPVQGVVEGKQVIRIDLIGEQIEHKEAGTEGTVIDINANLKLNGKAVNNQEAINLNYTNAKANSYNEGAQIGTAQTPINIISPKSLITTNEVTELGIATYGEEEGVKQTIPVGAEAKTLTVEEDVINNNGSDITNVQILGTFGTKGKTQIGEKEYQSNINSSVASLISVENIDPSKVSIYYTENENATADIEDLNNRWQPTITNPGAAKKYLVIASDMVNAEEMKIKYAINVPAGLEYKQEMYQGYVATYNDNQAQNPVQIVASTIGLETGNGPQINVGMTAKVGNEILEQNAEVSRGEIIRYDLNIKNTGEEEIPSAKLSVAIPEGTKLIDRSGQEGTKELDNKSIELDLGNIQVGETKLTYFEVRVSKEANTGNQIKAKATVTYGAIQKESDELIAVVGEAPGDITVDVIYAGLDFGEPTYKLGDQVECSIVITNKTESTINNIKATWNIPEEVELTLNNINVEPTSNNTITIDELEAGRIRVIYAKFKVIKNTKKPNITFSAQAQYNGTVYRSTSKDIKMSYLEGVTASMTSDIQSGEYVEPGDVITYTTKITNKSDINYNIIKIGDQIPRQFTIQEINEVAADGTSTPIEWSSNNLYYVTQLKAKEEKSIVIKTIVNYQSQLKEDLELTNQLTVKDEGENELATTNQIIHYMKANVEPLPSPTPSEEPTTSPTINPTTEPTDEPQNNERTITGLAWIDGDLNGAKDDYENTVPNIPVKLLDTKTNEFVKNEDGSELVDYTDDTGYYTLENIPEGKYIVVFEYDATQYKVTEYKKEGVEDSRNSKAISKRIKVDGIEKIYGVTDIIEIGERAKISGVNIGLVTTGKFDFGLEKTVSKITVRTSDGEVKTYNYDDETLAKIELDSKKMNGANIIVEYDITVRNHGEVSGYVATIEDKVPTDLTFSSDLNKDWYEEGTVLKTNALGNKAIAPGESKTIKLVLTKAMTENNTGILANTAEITEAYNEEGTQDVNSIPGNNNKTENDYGAADVIVSVKTGSEVVYTTLILIIISIIGIGVYFIRRETIQFSKFDDDIFKGL